MHYTSIHAVPTASEDSRTRIERVACSLEDGERIAQSDASKLTFEAATLHFQRQWGDREGTLKAQAQAQDLIAHQLCHDLYDSLELLKKVETAIDTQPGLGRISNLVRGAKENIRAGFAGPWLQRYRMKVDEHEPVWATVQAPSDASIRRLFDFFDLRLETVCNAVRPMGSSPQLRRHHYVDGVPHGEALHWNLGEEGAGAEQFSRMDDSSPMWPFSYSRSSPTFTKEGQRSLLFSPHHELLRNALSAAEDMAPEEAKRGIEVGIDVASGGSRISGFVRNAISRSQGVSAFAENLGDKLAQMSLGLSAEVSVSSGMLEISWSIALGES